MENLTTKVRYNGVYGDFCFSGAIGKPKKFSPEVGQEFFILNSSFHNIIDQGYGKDFEIIDKDYLLELSILVALLGMTISLITWVL